MAETFNYTNRVEIDNHHVHITLVRQGGENRFRAAIEFDKYNFAPSARVFIEAYRSNHLIRFDFGTVAAFEAPADTSVDEFGNEVDAVLYRVKVVGNDERKAILGMPRRGIGTRAENAEGGAADCILPIGSLPENSEQVWAMDFEGDYPRLCVNRRIEKQMISKGFFVALVYPAALRSVLEYTFLLHHDGEGCNWAGDWKQFAAENLDEEFPGLSGAPEYDAGDRQAISDWIDNVIEAFVANAKLVEKVNGVVQ